jgi:hypothetical protein
MQDKNANVVASATAEFSEVLQDLLQAQDVPGLGLKGRYTMLALNKTTYAAIGILVVLGVFGPSSKCGGSNPEFRPSASSRAHCDNVRRQRRDCILRA